MFGWSRDLFRWQASHLVGSYFSTQCLMPTKQLCVVPSHACSYAEGGSYEGERISWRKVAVLLRCPSNVLVIGQGLPGSLPWGMILTFFNDFLSQNKGFTVQVRTTQPSRPAPFLRRLSFIIPHKPVR